MNLFVTSDTIGSETGGGVVTTNELKAMPGPISVINPPSMSDPFASDEIALSVYKNEYRHLMIAGKSIAHFYAGTYSKLIKILKTDGVKISYTAAAHDINLSRQEYEKLGCNFDYPH